MVMKIHQKDQPIIYQKINLTKVDQVPYIQHNNIQTIKN
jgi:hypothetical protein